MEQEKGRSRVSSSAGVYPGSLCGTFACLGLLQTYYSTINIFLARLSHLTSVDEPNYHKCPPSSVGLNICNKCIPRTPAGVLTARPPLVLIFCKPQRQEINPSLIQSLLTVMRRSILYALPQMEMLTNEASFALACEPGEEP